MWLFVAKKFGEGIGVVYLDQPDDAIARALELAASGQIDEIGCQARRFAERCSWDTVADAFEKVLEDARAKRGELQLRKNKEKSKWP